MRSKDEKEVTKQIERRKVTNSIIKKYPYATEFEVLTMVGLKLSEDTKKR